MADSCFCLRCFRNSSTSLFTQWQALWTSFGVLRYKATTTFSHHYHLDYATVPAASNAIPRTDFSSRDYRLLSRDSGAAPAVLAGYRIILQHRYLRRRVVDDNLHYLAFRIQRFSNLLVATTLGRLVLNIATTRLILTRTDGNDLGSAGEVIQAFGEFVAGDRLEVGIILFVIIFVINFVVITKGATRIGEVAARFALDGMPGRQMAIDADLSAGAINEKEAQRRRDELTRQADFYGAMDGASKFVRGDAIAGIIITLINIIGGLYIGTMYSGMTLAEAGEVFTKLTIGDGLVSQVPAFLISLAAALLTTRSTQQSNLPKEFLQQIFAHPRALIVSGAFLLLLMTTQLPTIPLMTMGLGCIGIAMIMQKSTKQKLAQEAAAKHAVDTAPKPPVEKKVEEYLDVDSIRLELGAKLIVLADVNRGGDLMKRISTVRATLATEMAFCCRWSASRTKCPCKSLNTKSKYLEIELQETI